MLPGVLARSDSILERFLMILNSRSTSAKDQVKYQVIHITLKPTTKQATGGCTFNKTFSISVYNNFFQKSSNINTSTHTRREEADVSFSYMLKTYIGFVLRYLEFILIP